MPDRPAPGSIVHVELYSDDVEATRAFYEQAFDYQFFEAEDVEYTMFEAPGAPHGGLVDRAKLDGHEPPGTLAYLYVEDLDDVLDRVDRAGGTPLGEPVKIPDTGRIALFEAPGGIVQALWQDLDPARSNATLPPDDPPLGAIIHVELHSGDGDATARFYRDVFGWTFTELEETPYRLATLPSPPDGGLMPRTEGPVDPPSTLVYLLVEDVNEALSRVYHAGGRVIGERYEIEDMGAFGLFEAPGGIVQAVWERV